MAVRLSLCASVRALVFRTAFTYAHAVDLGVVVVVVVGCAFCVLLRDG